MGQKDQPFFELPVLCQCPQKTNSPLGAFNDDCQSKSRQKKAANIWFSTISDIWGIHFSGVKNEKKNDILLLFFTV